jgi:hypothetical protein
MSHLPEFWVQSAARTAGASAAEFCAVASDNSRSASALSADAMAMAPRLAELSQASHALAGLLDAMRVQRAFNVPIGEETLEAVVGVQEHLEKASERLHGANTELVTHVKLLTSSTAALVNALGIDRIDSRAAPTIGDAARLTPALAPPSSADLRVREGLGLLFVDAIESIVESSLPFIKDWLAARDSAPGQHAGPALRAFLNTAWQIGHGPDDESIEDVVRISEGRIVS